MPTKYNNFLKKNLKIILLLIFKFRENRNTYKVIILIAIITFIFLSYISSVYVAFAVFSGGLILLVPIYIAVTIIIQTNLFRETLFEIDSSKNVKFIQQKKISKHEIKNLKEYDSIKTHYAFHNIKNAVKNMAWILDDIDTLKENADILKVNIKKVFDTLDDFYNYSSFENKKSFSLAELQDIIVKFIIPSLRSKKIFLTFEVIDKTSLSTIFYHDFDDIFSILNNVIVNAEKALDNSEKKEISIKVNSKRSDEVIFDISDSGCGIHKDIRKDIFKFNFSTTGGTGIGLAYILDELNNINGKIELLENEDSSNFVTTFKIRIPVYPKEWDI